MLPDKSMQSVQSHGEVSATERQLQIIRKEEIRASILVLEEEARKHPQLDLNTRHHFSRGVYAREMTALAGTMVTGAIHRFSQVNILSKGEVSVMTDDGLIRIKAPYTLVAEAGAKRAFYVHEDCVWTTICGTHETDIDRLEEELTVESFKQLESQCADKELEGK